MTEPASKSCTAFDGLRLLSAGRLGDVALAVKAACEAGAAGPLLVFEDATGRVVDLDLRGSQAEIVARLSEAITSGAGPTKSRSSAPSAAQTPAEPGGRGRPKLGVVGREVTLLPRQWEWLASQPGGASVTLRKLVEVARRSGASKRKEAQEAAYRVMSALAGNLPGYEEATRALFASDRAAFDRHVAGWPKDVRAFATRLAFGEAAET